MCKKARVTFFNDWEARLAENGLDSPAEITGTPGIPSDHGEHWTLHRLPPLADGSIPLLKRFGSRHRDPGLMRAESERERIRRFRALGLPGPECAALGFDEGEQVTFLLLLARGALCPLPEYLKGASPREQREVLLRLARSLNRVHDAGVRLPGIRADRIWVFENDHPCFVHIGDAVFRAPGREGRLEDLARIFSTLERRSASRTTRLRVLKAFLEGSEKGHPQRGSIRRAWRRLSLLERSARKAGCFPVFFPVLEETGEGTRLVRNASLAVSMEACGLRKLEDFHAPGPAATLLRDLGIRRNYRVEGRGGTFYLKVHREKAGAAGHVSGRREWDHHLRLLQMGIPVAVPAAWGQGPGFSFFAAGAVSGLTADDPALGWAGLSPARRLGLIRTLAHLVARLHRERCYHRDLYLCHVLVRHEQCTLIDLQRLEEHPPFQRHRRVKDLAALLYSSRAMPLSRTERMRFFRYYHGGGRLGRAAKGLLRAVERKARRIEARQGRRDDGK